MQLDFADEQETERKPESRKLELNGYLTKPTTRLGRYPLLLEAVLKYTPDDSPDKQDLPEVIQMIRGLLTKVNIESGKSENIFELAQLEQQLVFRPHETIVSEHEMAALTSGSPIARQEPRAGLQGSFEAARRQSRRDSGFDGVLVRPCFPACQAEMGQQGGAVSSIPKSEWLNLERS